VTSRPVRAVIFDFGGVLTTPIRDSIAAWLSADGIRPESFSSTLKEWLGRNADAGTPIHRLETGDLSEAEFDALLAARLTTYAGTPVDPTGVLRRLFGHLERDDATYLLIEDLKAAGLKVALLSNSWGDIYPRAELDALLDVVVISEEVGLRKPEAAIYRLVLDRLGVPAEEAVFVDDAEPNLVGARAVGLATVLHQDAATTRRSLAALVPELATLEESA
jgi:epoxide hydrolase-like predicted phosphatase